MTHAEHFLSRLDRVALPHVELALSLYRDDDLLRYILQSSRLPERAERVAISLEDPNEGPFLVVTREGRFVTCLGKGMRSGDLPVVTRGQLDGLTERLGAHRERLAMRAKLAGPGGETGQLLRRLVDAGPYLSREEFSAIASFQPMLEEQFFQLMLDSFAACVEGRETMRRVLKQTDKPGRQWYPKLLALGKLFWATGHFALLAAMSGPDPYEGRKTPEGLPHTALFSNVTMIEGIVAQMARGAWCAARMGKSLLAYYKHRYSTRTNSLELYETIFSLLAIASRHSRVRAEVRKALLPPPARLSEELTRIVTTLGNVGLSYVDDPDQATLQNGILGAAFAVELGATLPAGSPFRYARVEDVPQDLALALATSFPNDVTQDAPALLQMTYLAPWIARMEPEQLYLPKAYIDAVMPPWRAEDTLQLLAGWIREVRAYVPPRPEGPTRNGACPCGSGKKYKRCCGA